jgi:L-lactate dehydrogenase complex protein LldG
MTATEARSNILRRLRTTRPGPAGCPMPSAVGVFLWRGEELRVRFTERLTAGHGEVQSVAADWPRGLYDLLAQRGVRHVWYGPGGAAAIDLKRSWPDAAAVRLRPYREPIEQCLEEIFDPAAAGFTTCRGAIAETGSLVLWPGPEEPRLLSLVPPVHVVLLAVGSIHVTLSALLRAQGWERGLPTNALLISGPSKSADIEQTLTYGVHGPRELIVLLR